MDNNNQQITIKDIELSSNIKKEIKKDEQYETISTDDKSQDASLLKSNNPIEEQASNEPKSICQYKKIGNCYSLLYNSKGVPLIIIGPDSIVYVWLSFFTSIGTYAFVWFFNPYLGYYTKSIGVALHCVFMLSYTYMLLSNPGFPGHGSYNKAVDEEVVYCQFCKMYLPLTKRYMHCNDCGLCIEGRDHHCQWISKCIGKWNMKPFYAFCLSIFFLILFFILSLIVIQNNYLKLNTKQ